jgi:hypothetical protein
VGIFSAYQWVLLRESRSYAILLTLFTLSALLLTLMALPVRGRGRGACPSLAPFGTLFLDGIQLPLDGLVLGLPTHTVYHLVFSFTVNGINRVPHGRTLRELQILGNIFYFHCSILCL